MKKCSGFVKKLRHLGENYQVLILEFTNLRLSKYLSEAANALLDNELKLSAEYRGFLELASLFHIYYSEFSGILTQELNVRMSARERSDSSENTSRKEKQFLRLSAELVITGIISDPSYFIDKFKVLVAGENLCNFQFLPTANYLIKTIGNFYTDTSFGVVSSKESLVFSELLGAYFKELARMLVRVHTKLEAIEVRGKVHYENRGDLTDRQVTFWTSTKEQYQSLLSGLETFAELIGSELPHLNESSNAPIIVEGKIVFADNNLIRELQQNSLYDSEEDRSFYEDIVQLKDLIPATLLPATQSTETLLHDETFNIAEIDPELRLPHFCDSTESGISKLHEILSSMHSSQSVDRAASEFCFMASRPSSKSLGSILLELSRNRADLIPFISRFLATLKSSFPEVCEAVSTSVAGQFFFLLRKTDPIRATRIRICRFIGELAKFRVMSQGKVFECIRRSAEDFSPTSIDMLCTILESCGRFLLAQPESHARIENILEMIMRKKQCGHLDQSRVMMIENAIYLTRIRNDITTKEPAEEKSILQLYSEWLVYESLRPHNVRDVFQRLRELPWGDNDFQTLMKNILTGCWKLNTESLPALASMIAGLSSTQPVFVSEVIDDLIENVSLGLESVYSNWSLRRVSTIRLLGELYIYSAIDLDVVFHLLHLLLPSGRLANDTEYEFRLQIICILLDIVGDYLKTGDATRAFEKYKETFRQHLEGFGPFSFETEMLLQDICDRFDLEPNYDMNNDEGNFDIESVKEDEFSEINDESAANFDKDLQSVLTESIDERKLAKKPTLFDLSMPIQAMSNPTSNGDIVSFKLLTKKKNRPVTKEISVAIEPSLAESIKTQQNLQKHELEVIRQLTLDSQRAESVGSPFSHWNDVLLAPIRQLPAPSRSELEKARNRRRPWFKKY